ncbi:MAG: UDP-N-acetylmuramoyl-L-alanine--D-glutamate ligase [Usitatibacter sp.]
MSDEWKGKSVLVLGLGDTGLSVVRWLARRGSRLRAADTRAAPPSLGTVRADHPDVGVALGPFDEALLAGVDAVVASPGVALGEPVLRAAAARGIEILGDVEIFAREIAQRGNARVIGVTGTNGKSTVTALVAAMAQAAARRAVAIGNIGVPVLEMMEAPDFDRVEVIVVELSSYQLETTSSLHLDAGAVLNVTQDHLDRYPGMEGYAAAKARIFNHCRTRVVNREDPRTLAMAGGHADTLTFGLDVPKGEREWGLDPARSQLRRGERSLLAVDDMAMQGLHNAANALAAHALGTAIGLPERPMATAIRQFRGLPHRVELVAEACGVRFFDDSKGTNVGSTVAALAGFRTPLVLIAGGDGKGQDFAPLAAAVAARPPRAVVLIGRDAPVLEAALKDTGVAIERVETMPQAVEAAFNRARAGDAVLLSPACASLDMFRNYGHRGDVFAEAARALAARISPSPRSTGTDHSSKPDVLCPPKKP